MTAFRKIILPFQLLAISLLLACNISTSCQAVGDKSQTLIPREVIFGNPEKANVKLSHDGAYLSFVAPVDGVLNVWVGPREDWKQAKPITHDKKRGVFKYFWPHDPEHVLYLQDKDGDEDWHLYRVNVRTKAVKDLTPFDKIQTRVVQISKRFPDEILIGINNRNPEFHDLYRLNIKSGKLTLVEKNDEFESYVADWNLTPRIANRMTADGGSEFLQKQGNSWQPYQKITMEDLYNTEPLAFDDSGETLYWQDSRGRNTSALIAQNLKTDKKQILAEDARADMSDYLVHPQTKQPQAFASNYTRKNWQFLDKNIIKDIEYLQGIERGELEVISRSQDDHYWVVNYMQDDGPIKFYLYDRQLQKAEFLFSHRPALEGLPLVQMHPEVIKSRDGWDMVSYLSLPASTTIKRQNRPDQPIPMVLFVHGGPWSRDEWGYNPIHQWLANRGYAVLSVNFRSSTGFGKDFVVAGNGEWGGKAHDDLIDAVNWAVAEKIADPSKVAIMGGSYGGYATLAGLTMTPDVFACGVDIVGPSSLETLLKSIPAYWKTYSDDFKLRVGGDPETKEGLAFLKERSPLTHVHRIQRPLLIGQGANDPRVKQAEADQIVAAMRKNKIPVTYVLYSDEGHGFARPENRLSFYAVTEAFLARSLGGKLEPVGTAFKNSTIDIKVSDGLNVKTTNTVDTTS